MLEIANIFIRSYKVVFKHIKAILSSSVSAKACKKTRIQSIVCLLVASASVTLSSLSAFALYQKNASTETPVDVEGLSKSNLVAKNTKSQNVVEKDGLQFETLIPEAVIKIPENKPDARALIRFGCRITNKTQNPVRVSGFEVLEPKSTFLSPFTAEKNIIGWGGSSDSRLSFYPRKSDFPPSKQSVETMFPLLLPGESTTFFLDGYIFWYENKLSIQVGGLDSYWNLISFNSKLRQVSLDVGEYAFWFKYEKQDKKAGATGLWVSEGKEPAEDFWLGSIETPAAKFRLVKAK